VCLHPGWFFGACVVVTALIAGVIYLVFARRSDTFLRRHLEARLDERERASRELHDMLVQGIQGLILRFQAVAERIPPREPARDMMEKALERADEVLVTTRDRFGAQVGDVRDEIPKRVP
jgi:signal transduction histidine kinase